MGPRQHAGHKHVPDEELEDGRGAATTEDHSAGRRETTTAAPVIGRAFADHGENDPLGGTHAGADVDAALQRRRGRGAALPEDLATAMGSQLGHDLSGVRIHHDQEADSIARSVQSTAFTFGSDIYFTQGGYRPEDRGGQHLLAHELAHVVQQRSRPTASRTGPGPVSAARRRPRPRVPRRPRGRPSYDAPTMTRPPNGRASWRPLAGAGVPTRLAPLDRRRQCRLPRRPRLRCRPERLCRAGVMLRPALLRPALL